MTRAPQGPSSRKVSLDLPPALRVSRFKAADAHYIVLSFVVGPHEGGPRVRAEPSSRTALARLTPAERAVFAHVLRGRSNDQIAAERGVSRRTVANQLARIYDKVGVRGRAMLLARYGGRDAD